MLNNLNQSKYKFKYCGQTGRPENFPIPQIDGLLFYIQRNLNTNTVVYVVNKMPDGYLNEQYPMKVYWVRYDTGGEIMELNLIQNKLAFGYKSWKINNEAFKFQMVSYDRLDFYLSKDKIGNYQVTSMFDNQRANISNIFAYAEEFGIFPQVKFIEFFGNKTEDNFPVYKKILI